MKKWFNGLESNKHTFIIVVLYIANFISLIIFGVTDEESIMETCMAFVYLATIIWSIIFTIWRIKNHIINKNKKLNRIN